jgi:hypothetical protein
MSEAPINYEAVLADLEARKAKLEAAIESIRAILAQGGAGTSGPIGPSGSIAPDAFLQMSIPDATKKYLGSTRQKQSTQAIIDALEKGGLPKSKYNTVYSILSRRQKQVGDIINMDGDWALAEWYPNYKRKKSAEEEAQEESAAKLEELQKLAAQEKEKKAAAKSA